MKPERWGKRGSWCVVGFVLPMMMIMVSPALSATGWYNWFNSANNTMYWMYNGNWRLAYTYGAGQWWDCTQLGGTDNWNKLGSTGQASTFLGNASIGWYLPVGNGWNYGYDTRNDVGYWKHGDNATFRFAYGYTEGQWCDQGYSAWNKIGGKGVSSTFIGDGSLHDVNNGWSYQYLVSGDSGYWMTSNNIFSGKYRLAYFYPSGQWFDYGDTWRALGSPGVDSAFIGNAAIGAYYYLDNGWYYGYNKDQDLAYWMNSTTPGTFRFAYCYYFAQWFDSGHGAHGVAGWDKLGTAGISSAFIGDGSFHNVGTNDAWSYLYRSSEDKSLWREYTGVTRLAYEYTVGQWWDYGATGWNTLGGSGQNSDFIGNRSMWSIGLPSTFDPSFGSGDSWFYSWTFDSLSSYAVYTLAVVMHFHGGFNEDVYRYRYSDGMWQQKTSGGWVDLGPSGQSSKADALLKQYIGL
jgi:hypothetical protein